MGRSVQRPLQQQQVEARRAGAGRVSSQPAGARAHLLRHQLRRHRLRFKARQVSHHAARLREGNWWPAGSQQAVSRRLGESKTQRAVGGLRRGRWLLVAASGAAWLQAGCVLSGCLFLAA